MSIAIALKSYKNPPQKFGQRFDCRRPEFVISENAPCQHLCFGFFRGISSPSSGHEFVPRCVAFILRVLCLQLMTSSRSRLVGTPLMDIEEAIAAFGETEVWLESDLCGCAYEGPGVRKTVATGAGANVCVACLRESAAKTTEIRQFTPSLSEKIQVAGLFPRS